MKRKQLLFAVLGAMLLAGCSEKTEEATTKVQITGIPFQTEVDGSWSMLSPEGEVIFEDEFTEQPFLAFEDRFFVTEENGLHALYTAEETPELLASGFSYANKFIDGRAVVSKPGEYIQMIDTEGNVIKTLDKVSGKTIDKVYVAEDGRMRFETTDHYWGLLDADGKVLLEPEYGVLWYEDGTVLCNPMDEQKFYYRHIPEKMTDHIMDIQGEELGTIKGSKHITTEILEGGEYLSCYKAHNGDRKYYGIFDTNGKTVIKPNKNIQGVSLLRYGELIFTDGDKYGLMNLQGDVIVEPQYDKLWFWGDKLLLAGENDEYDDIVGVLIDRDGKQASEEEFKMNLAIDFDRLGNKHAMVQLEDDTWVLANRDGSLVEDLPDIFNISTWTRVEDFVQNCYIDPEHIADELKITAEGCDGLTVYMTPEEFVNAKKEELTDFVFENPMDEDMKGEDLEEFMETKPITSPYYYTAYDIDNDDKDINLKLDIDGVRYYTTPYFRDGMVKNGEFVKKPVKNIEYYFPNSGKTNGHLERLFQAFAKKIRPFGNVLAENGGYLCIWTNKVLIELRKNANGNGVSLYYTRVPEDRIPNQDYINEQALERKDVKENCPKVVED